MEEQQPQPCPLVTHYATATSVERKLRPFSAIDPALLEKLYVIRKWPIDPDAPIIPFKRPSFVRDNIWNTNKDCPTDEPLVIKEFQKQAIHHLIRMPRFILGDAVGLGKTLDALVAFAWLKERNPDAKMVVITTKSTAQPLDAKISTPSGWKTMGEMQVGDSVHDPDGGIAFVEGVYPKGEKRVYRVTTEDGSYTEACEDHLWLVQTLHSRRSGRFFIRDTKSMAAQGVKYGDSYRFRLPLTQPVEFVQSETIPINAYVLGVLLGDGSLRYGAIFYNQSKELVELVRNRIPKDYRISCWSAGHWAIVSKQRKFAQKNSIFSDVRHLGINCLSPQKFIPTLYKKVGITERIDLLRGLMDTDGSCSKDGQATFTTTSLRLRDDIIELVQSLGGLAFWTQSYPPSNVGKKTKFVITVRTQFNPFSIRRKATRWHKPRDGRAIVSIEYVGTKPVQCLKVSSKRHLYITDGFMVTHNTYQWMDECHRFTTLRPYVMRDSYGDLKSSEARYAQMIKFFEGGEKDILIVKYDSLKGTRKWVEGVDHAGKPTKKREDMSEETKMFGTIFKQHRGNLVLVLDECHRFKSEWTATRNLVWVLCRYPERVWALTATVIKNGMDEFYSIATAIGVRPLGWMKMFHEEYCRWRQQHVGNGRFKKILVGYENVPTFMRELRPFFFGRSQRQVKERLPRLTTVYHPIDLDARQVKILSEDLPNGTIELPPILFKVAGEWWEKERDPENMMTQLSVQQLVTNHWGLLDRNDEKTFLTKALSPKEEALLDMLDGDYRGEKVVVYTKYRSWIDRLEWLTKEGLFTERKFLRITGNENEKQRGENKALFQDPDSGYDLIAVNAAGIEGINLQQAAHMILLDVPWSWGDLIQLVGRMVRMASPHAACTLHIMVAKGTIDEFAIETLRGKKGVFETILGESHSAGILDSGESFNLDSGMESDGGNDEEFRALLEAHVKRVGMKIFLGGGEILKAQSDIQYKMAFERGSKKRQKKAEVRHEDTQWFTE